MYLLTPWEKTNPLHLRTRARAPDCPEIVAANCNENIKNNAFESNGKKVNFLKTVIDKVHLKNASVIQQEAKTLHGKGTYGQKFESVTMRALRNLKQQWN
jgi:16S rRNA G527 N7-methylase RsmG